MFTFKEQLLGEGSPQEGNMLLTLYSLGILSIQKLWCST